MARLIESVPNISEGRRPEVVSEAVAAIGRAPGVRLLDVQSDKDHNRSVLTLVGEAGGLKEALLGLYQVATARIDLRTHQGEHPRVGAVDVVPFIPIEGVTMADCVALAREVGQAVAERFGVPVFLYEEAATAPNRRNLEDVRRGRIPVPILLHNALLIRPFERLLRGYGLPRYGEVEPSSDARQ